MESTRSHKAAAIEFLRLVASGKVREAYRKRVARAARRPRREDRRP